MTRTATAPSRAAKNAPALADALAAFDEGARLLEQAYRELWATHAGQRSTQELAAAERIRDLCHDLRNPLGGVRGLASLLRRELSGRDASERAVRLLDRMDEGLLAMDSLLRGHGERDEQRADAGAIAEETASLTLAESRAEGGSVEIRVEAPSGIELPLPAAAFREVLANLVRNAAQACGERGTVRIRIESRWDDVLVWVEDDGPGLPSVPDEVLFRRGFSTKGSGRGRGLAIAAGIVERAGGSIRLCRLQPGTLARVRIPRR
jgi:signal transduction histidine kinase